MRFVDKFIVVVLVASAAVLTFGAFYFKPPSPLLIEQARVPGADGGSFHASPVDTQSRFL